MSKRRSAMSNSNSSASGRPIRRRARAMVTLLVAVVAMLAGLAGGWWYGVRGIAGPLVQTPMADAGADDGEQWYTCGMHPNVLQKGPGDCPICHMKLTPRKDDDAESHGNVGGPTERKVIYWRAPMDPHYVSDKPGKSPMGMDLVPVYADEDESASAHAVRIDPVTIQNMGIRTGVIKRGPLVKIIRTVGRVDYNEQLVTFINTKFSGWIERLHVDQTGQAVSKGQPLFDVYSPELYAAQEEYLAAVRSLPILEGSTFAPAIQEASRLVESALTKLKYMDVSDEQIAAIRDAKKVEKTLTIHSPAGGIVTEKMAIEGMYVMPGMRLYTVADLSRIWVYVDIYEYQLPWVYAGQPARMSLPYVTGREFSGKIIYVYPYLETMTRAIKVRLEFENPDLELKPGMYANIKLDSELSREALLIPREAYIDSGERKLTFVDRGAGKFEPRDIQTGVEAENGMVEVLYGLDEGEVVVTSGQFLLDGESKLKEATAKMMDAERARGTPAPAKDRKPPPTHDSGIPHPSGDANVIPADAAYACPMDKHPDETDPAKQGAYFSAEPGKCPWCGMILKPVDELSWVRARRAAQGAEVAYTCPDHPHVFSQSEGTCPRCSRALAPFKVMYTCPDADHAGVIATSPGKCGHCARILVPYRGIWLDEQMADMNVPPSPGLADAAAYRCAIHPLVHSESPGLCTICAQPLTPTAPEMTAERKSIPANAGYTCPMRECWQFSDRPGDCSICGMHLEPIENVDWARELREGE